MRWKTLVFAVAALALAIVPSANASWLIDRNASAIHLATDNTGRALVSYKAHGRAFHVLAWGAINARQPNPSVPQVKFKLDYSGGRDKVWRSFKNTCQRYDGDPLAWSITACKATDGSYWALQSWQRALPNAGYRPWLASQKVWELRLSHWSGPIAEFEIYTDWIYSGRFHDLFGRVSYNGVGIHGFHTTSQGAPLDTYGRNLYLDTLDSAYGPGWHRENSFVAHGPTSGMFCYGFYPYSSYPGYPTQRTEKINGAGKKYRITMIGPGVTPDIMWAGDGLQDYDKNNPELVDWERQMNQKLDEMRANYGETKCKQH
jgi:hypothetical protein